MTPTTLETMDVKYDKCNVSVPDLRWGFKYMKYILLSNTNLRAVSGTGDSTYPVPVLPTPNALRHFIKSTGQLLPMAKPVFLHQKPLERYVEYIEHYTI